MRTLIIIFILLAVNSIYSQKLEYIHGFILDKNSEPINESVRVLVVDESDQMFSSTIDKLDGEFFIKGTYIVGELYLIKIISPNYGLIEVAISPMAGGIIRDPIKITRIENTFLFIFLRDENNLPIHNVSIRTDFNDTIIFTDSIGLAKIELPNRLVKSNTNFKLILNKKNYEQVVLNNPMSKYLNNEFIHKLEKIKTPNIHRFNFFHSVRPREYYGAGASALMFIVGVIYGERAKEINRDIIRSINEEDLLRLHPELSTSEDVLDKRERKRNIANTLIDLSLVTSVTTLTLYSFPLSRWSIDLKIDASGMIEKNTFGVIINL